MDKQRRSARRRAFPSPPSSDTLLTNVACRYTLATSLSSSLDTTSNSLTSLIQTLNSLSPALRPSTLSGAAEDPLTQIAAILNAHLGSLRWIGGTTESLKKNVLELEGRVGQVSGRGEKGTPSRSVESPYRR